MMLYTEIFRRPDEVQVLNRWAATFAGRLNAKYFQRFDNQSNGRWWLCASGVVLKFKHQVFEHGYSMLSVLFQCVHTLLSE